PLEDQMEDHPDNLRDHAEFTRRQLLRRGAAFGVAAALGGAFPRLASAQRLCDVVREADIAKLVWSIPGTPTSLDLATNFDYPAWDVTNLIHEELLSIGPHGELVPVLAESVTRQSATEYIYHLRPGVHFSDGSPLTAADVQYSYTRHL